MNELLRQGNTLKNKINSRLQSEINRLKPDLDRAEDALKTAEDKHKNAPAAEKAAAKTELDAAQKARDEQAAKVNVPTTRMAENDKYWDDFRAGIKETISLSSATETPKPLNELRSEAIKEIEQGESITALNPQFAQTVEAYRDWEKSRDAVTSNRTQYNNTMMNIPASGTAAATA